MWGCRGVWGLAWCVSSNPSGVGWGMEEGVRTGDGPQRAHVLSPRSLNGAFWTAAHGPSPSSQAKAPDVSEVFPRSLWGELQLYTARGTEVQVTNDGRTRGFSFKEKLHRNAQCHCTSA